MHNNDTTEMVMGEGIWNEECGEEMSKCSSSTIGVIIGSSTLNATVGTISIATI